MSTLSACQSSAEAQSDRSPDRHHDEDWIHEAAFVCREAAQGNLERRMLRIDNGSPAAEMQHAINHLLDMTDAFVREAVASLEHACHGKFYRRVLLEGMRGSFRTAAEEINHATAGMERNTLALRDAESRRAALAEEFRMAKQVVDELAHASQQIGNISDTIREIANQSNLLALNATIETARVGEAGAGFGVVAAEVKRLSERTAAATREIARKVGAIQKSSTEVSLVIEQIYQTMRGEGLSTAPPG